MRIRSEMTHSIKQLGDRFEYLSIESLLKTIFSKHG